ncbi:hypothetical protein M409DRAFT_51970 [Zasmidium cellare ATCC 36951]|uniref:Uncharacterized protein n=1 Tax=Zasmidium cellare ATCC 36951 TaxID=1080233 RepID=A0A6A6CVK2_ZASCE|nr:uncharacterized protein M409DRAFT_51970 [Zasmidium cellare ATCC 36951]KAF2170228.1 hypothetical protein M409DRAFT_51970 [Zasmidium cellare ATCC 36951]
MASGERTTMRMNLADLMRLAGQEEATSSGSTEPGTIYYLKTATPHLHDVSVSGPYKDLEAVYAQVWHNFGDECQHGRSMLEDLKVNDQPVAFQHIESPIYGDANKKRRIELIPKTKPDLAAKLPSPVWNVTKAKIANEALAAGPTGPNRDALPVKDVQIIDSFESEASAKQAAQNALRDITGPGDMSQTVSTSPFAAGVIGRQGLKWVVTVNRDSGTTTQQQ